MSDGLYGQRVKLGQSKPASPSQKPPVEREWSVGSFTSDTLNGQLKPNKTQVLPTQAYAHIRRIEEAKAAEPPQFQAPTPVLAPKLLTQQEAFNLAVNDPITATFNFEYITTILKRELERAFFCKRPLSVMVVSVSNMATIGIKCGALAVEETKQLTAKLIQNNCRPIDMVGSFKEGRFIVICPEMDANDAYQYSANICEAAKSLQVADQFDFADVEVCVGIYQIAEGIQLQDLTTTLAIADVCADLAADQGPYKYFLQP